MNTFTIIPFHSPRGCLSYLVADENSKQAALIDPSEEIAEATYLDALTKGGYTLTYLIETHTHADHLSSAPALARATHAKIARHTEAPSPAKDIAVGNDDTLPLGAQALRILATPGHTNESISIVAGDALFTGDALLIEGTGRTDFQLGDSAALYDSLTRVYGTLPDDTRVYPAHDYRGRTSSTLGHERSENPRLRLSRDEFIAALDAHHPPTPELFEQSIAANSR